MLVEQDEGFYVHGDVVRLSQILTNLLVNAATFSDLGSTIRVRVEASDARVRVLVVDEGKGIDAKDLQRIFEAFVQLGERGLDRAGGGLGLGLSLARELARAHGGELSASSPGLGLGATFVLELPRLATEEEDLPPAALPPHKGAPDAVPPSQVRVLLVDDNVDAAEMLTYVLESKAYTVRVAHDGPSALREAGAFDPDVGILDIGLPGMDGFELAASLRRDPAHAHMRLIALTGYSAGSAIAKGRENAFDAHLLKPVDFQKLESCMELARDAAPAGHSASRAARGE